MKLTLDFYLHHKWIKNHYLIRLYLVHGEDDEYSYVKAFVNLENYINRLYIRNYEKYLKD